jgi:hypothetical protein
MNFQCLVVFVDENISKIYNFMDVPLMQDAPHENIKF